MGKTIELDTRHAVKVNPNENETIVVKNLGPGTAYYAETAKLTFTLKAAEPNGEVTIGESAGNIAENSSVTIEQPAGRWFMANKPGTLLEVTKSAGSAEERLFPEGVSTADIAAGAVTEPKLASEAVSEAKIKAEAVAASKVAQVTQPAAGAEKAVVVSSVGVGRKVVAVFTGDGALTACTVKHTLANNNVMVWAYKATAAVVTEPYLNAAGAGNFTWKVTGTNEVEVKFGTAPGAGAEVFIVVIG